MASTTFVDRQTVIQANWLNDVNSATYGTSTDPGENGFWPDVSPTTQIYRMRDRLFVGEGAAVTGNRSGTQGSFVPTGTDGANWAPRDSIGYFATKKGLMALTGFASNQDQTFGVSDPTECIGVSGFVINHAAAHGVWAGYFDVQVEAGAKGGLGMEIALKNKSGTEYTPRTYYQNFETCGIWMPAGGDTAYGGSPTNNNDVGIAFGSSVSSGKSWNRGIVFFNGSLTTSGGYSYAMSMGQGMTIEWTAPGNFTAFLVRSDISTSGKQKQLVASNTYLSLLGNNSKQVVTFQDSFTGDNYLNIGNAATGVAPFVQAVSAVDTDVDLRLLPQGAGLVRFGTWTSNADTAVTGYITIKDAAGNTRKIATIA